MNLYVVDVTAEIAELMEIAADSDDEATDRAIERMYRENPDAAYVRLNNVEEVNPC